MRKRKWIGIILIAVILFLFGKAGVSSLIKGAPLASTGDRTNILILGIGGGTHEGANLTDTMMVLSLDNVRKKMALISVPRDIWVESLQGKINSAYYYGEQKAPGGGITLAKATVEDVLGIPIHYALVIDFSGFQKVIDEVGGIDVTVPEAFTDTQYPCENTSCVYKTVSFAAGRQHMDGATALIYARSRHATGAEGSDFARSKRQQDIMIAFKDRLVRPLQWVTPSRLARLPQIMDEATTMDMSLAQALTVGRLFLGVQMADIKKISFEDKLTNPPADRYNGLYVLVPTDNWDAVRAYIKGQLQEPNL